MEVPHCSGLGLSLTGSGRTLRETVLESPPILALLNESFISTWSLVKELEDLQVSGLEQPTGAPGTVLGLRCQEGADCPHRATRRTHPTGSWPACTWRSTASLWR
jgi:hypothetical protein